MNDVKELDEWLDSFSEKVQRNVKIVTPQDLEQDHMLHISMDTNIRRFTPFISHRQSRQEDRTVPRVCVTPSLLGAFIGYASAEDNFFSLQPGESTSLDVVYRGGWKIYALPFKAALKPNGQLVWDSRNSDEHWLVAYNNKTAIYEPQAAGRVFCHSITLVGRSDKQPDGELTLYVEVTREDGIRFSKKHFLTKGYWRIEGPLFRSVFSPNDDKQYVVSEITKEDYLAAKNQTAALLGITDQPPAYLSW